MSPNETFDQLLDTVPRANAVAFGYAFELISDHALRSSVDFGADIDKIEPFAVWARGAGRDSTADLGVDRVITTKRGELWTVQNKGYSPKRTVSMGDFNDFVMASRTIPGVTRMILVTSGSGLGGNARKINDGANARVVVLDRTWLRQATTYPTTFEELLEGDLSTDRPEPYTYREDQLAAIEHITAALRKSPECQFISACGTGKTVTSVGIADSLGARTVIYFVPTLGLMRQTIRSVRQQHGGRGVTTVAVCSDDTVGTTAEDHAVFSEADLSCEVLHSSEEIASFTKENTLVGRRLVVFCTYQSEHLVVDAQHLHGAAQFDLAFCDEAHCLVGTDKDSTGLGDLVKRKDDRRARLKARWRVYATATPRVVSTRAAKRLAKQGAKAMDSMDYNSPVFGPVAHTFTFGEAITAGVLSDYQVSVIAVPEQKYVDFIRNRAFVENEDGRVLDAHTFASLEALKHAYGQGDRRIITYHNRVTAAQQFAELITSREGLPGADTIWGALPSSERERLINRITRPEGHILTNVRCLNEGIDIPTLDTIVFADPKSSPVDIAQSVGRVLRKAPGKTRGHIIVPVAVPTESWETGLLDEDAVNELGTIKSPFLPVFNVLEALSNHDETIRHTLTVLRLGLGKLRNRDIDRSDDFFNDDDDDFAGYLDDVTTGSGSLEEGVRGRGEIRLLGDKVVLHANGMTDEMLKQFADSIRLGIARRSRTQSNTDRDNAIIALHYKFGVPWADAEREIDEALENQVGRAA